MDRLQGFLIAVIVLLWLVLSQIAADAWTTEANYMDPRRGFSLAAIGLLSLVQPLTTNPWLTRARRRRTYLRTVWVVQFVAAVGGLWVVAAPIHPEIGVVVTVIAWLACLRASRRRTRPTRPWEVGQGGLPAP
jgi:hypothetical protein